MKLRWLIRTFAIALLTLCLSLWAWSYFYSFSVRYKSCWVETCMGGVHMGFGDMSRFSPGWRFQYDRDVYSLGELVGSRSFLGFACLWQEYAHIGTVSVLVIPFWFSSLLSAGLLWFVWRQTRPKSTGRGFPVEITQPKTDDTSETRP